jgi:predicted Rossmann fold flavoprotein
MQKTDVIIIGAGAAGLMCAIQAGKRNRQVIVLDHANKPGKKILMSGGGRCNFTNYHSSPENFISNNPHFCKSALTRYTQWDFIELVKKYQIPYHEKTLGQLFCDNKAKDILNMLLTECDQANVEIRLNTEIKKIEKINDHHYKIHSSRGDYHCESLVIASGGLSIPTMGASPFGYKIAEQFGLKIWPTRAGLVPLTLHTEDKDRLATLSGVAVDTLTSTSQKSFRENILFTHRGLSGPAILQISSYWQPGETITINLLPNSELEEYLQTQKQHQPQKQLKTILSELLPKRVIELFIPLLDNEKKLASLSQSTITQIATLINNWHIKPNGTEGYRTAEVTLGGVDCDAISSKTFAANNHPGLYFIGEVVDVTGWLGGYNFQWAWSSGWAAGQVV